MGDKNGVDSASRPELWGQEKQEGGERGALYFGASVRGCGDPGRKGGEEKVAKLASKEGTTIFIGGGGR